ncbi:MAG: hypothetical protein HQL01_05010 [Nitrospirae bacterium]|nr:hypothetical protein [Nitrospirota bacterium]
MANKKDLPNSKTLTIMFTDIVGSTPIANKLRAAHGNDDMYMEAVRGPHDELIRQCLTQHNGYEVKTIGDSFMAVFELPTEAIETAADIIKGLETNPADPQNPLQVRIGLHTGTVFPVIKDGKVVDYEGHDVNLAARVEGLADGGQILLSGAVKGMVSKLKDYKFHHWGKRTLKGIDEEVEIFELLWEGKKLGRKPSNYKKTFTYPSMYDNKDVIGRDGFINDVRGNIEHHKFLTICGIGGVGKTAAAIETCKYMGDEYDILFVGMDILDDKSSEGQIVGQIAKDMKLTGESSKGIVELAEAIRNRCADRPVLLLIDNYESIDKVLGRRVMAMLTGVPCLRILATSRSPVGIGGIEKELELEPFSTPDAGGKGIAALVEDLKSSDSYRLLEAHVRLLRGMDKWQVSDVDAEHVKSVLETTSGIPLAIELVASRMGSNTWQDAAATLNASFELMKVEEEICEGQPCPDRHLSMVACLNWSYEKLSEPARRLFRAISLFANGFETSLVEGCYGTLSKNNEGKAITGLLKELQTSSLISFVNGKWSFLPIVHRYGRDLLNDDEKKSEIEHAFISYWGNFVKEYSSSDEKRRKNLKLLEKEHGHLIEFLNLLHNNEDNHDMYIVITNSLHGFWQIERMWGDSHKYLKSALGIARTKAEKHPAAYLPKLADVCYNLAILLSDMGDDKGASELFAEAADISKRLKG